MLPAFTIVSLIFSVMGHELITIYSLKQIPSILLDRTECFFIIIIWKNQIIFAKVYANNRTGVESISVSSH